MSQASAGPPPFGAGRLRALAVATVLVVSLLLGDARDSVALAFGPLGPRNTWGLELSADGATVYDANLDVTWLADANLAADPEVRALLGVEGIEENGTMTYPTATKWVRALDRHRYLGRDDWQLPTTPTHPATDDTCAVPAGRDGNSFGPGCQRSALGRLYTSGFHREFPDAVVPVEDHRVALLTGTHAELHHLRAGMYWTAGSDGEVTEPDAEGAFTYSFLTGATGRKTTTGNYFHVLPVAHGVIGPLVEARPDRTGRVGRPPTTGLHAYAGDLGELAVYDADADLTWPLDGALGRFVDESDNPPYPITFPHGATVLRPPMIEREGKMSYRAAHRFQGDLNQRAFGGWSGWTLPTAEELGKLAARIHPDLLQDSAFGRPFRRLQPFFYWSCVGADGTSLVGCGTEPAGDGSGEGDGDPEMQWAFNLDSGFQGTDRKTRTYFVMVYHPGR